KPLSRVDILDSNGTLRGSAMSDDRGIFRLNVALATGAEQLIIAVTGPSGFRSESKIEIAVDAQQPAIELAEEPPRLTASATLFLRGQVTKPQASLSINGQA